MICKQIIDICRKTWYSELIKVMEELFMDQQKVDMYLMTNAK